MAIKISNEVKTALIVIGAFILFFFGINYLKGAGLFSNANTVHVVYDDVTGLTPSSFVQLNGLIIGSVKNIAFSTKNAGKIDVEMTLKSGVQLPKDSKAEIASQDLLGAKVIKITKGSSTEMVKDDGELATTSHVGMIDALGAKAGPLVDGASGTLSTINGTVANINSLLDAQTKQNLQATIAGMHASIKDLNVLTANLATQSAKINAIMASAGSFSTNLEKNNTSINKIMSNTEKTTNNLSKVELEGTVNNLKTTIGSLNTTIEKLNDTKGTAGLLLNDKKLYNDMQGSLHSLDALLADMKANPSRYVSFSLFGRKQKIVASTPSSPN